MVALVVLSDDSQVMLRTPPLCFTFSFDKMGKVALELKDIVVQEGEARTHMQPACVSFPCKCGFW